MVSVEGDKGAAEGAGGCGPGDKAKVDKGGGERRL